MRTTPHRANTARFDPGHNTIRHDDEHPIVSSSCTRRGVTHMDVHTQPRMLMLTRIHTRTQTKGRARAPHPTRSQVCSTSIPSTSTHEQTMQSRNSRRTNHLPPFGMHVQHPRRKPSHTTMRCPSAHPPIHRHPRHPSVELHANSVSIALHGRGGSQRSTRIASDLPTDQPPNLPPNLPPCLVHRMP